MEEAVDSNAALCVSRESLTDVGIKWVKGQRLHNGSSLYLVQARKHIYTKLHAIHTSTDLIRRDRVSDIGTHVC